MPKRIQRRRTKGWRMPEGAIYVGRPTRWGNPYPVGPYSQKGAVWRYADLIDMCAGFGTPYALGIERGKEGIWTRDVLDLIRTELAGHDLACWCALDKPCHADVLLKLANEGAGNNGCK